MRGGSLFIIMDKTINKTFSLVREYIFPLHCGVCDRALLDREEAFYGLCADCKREFSVEHTERCSLCGRPLISEIEVCLPCRRKPPSQLDYIISLFPYAGIYHSLLSAYKFKKHKNIGNFFAEKIMEGIELLKKIKGEGLEKLSLVPVPPRHKKIKQEGWDQIEYLARIFEKFEKRGRNIPVRRCLIRLPSKTQKELNREERQSNLLRRIECLKTPPKKAILFDDVITTGSTMEACASSLKRAGCDKVYGISLFYV